MSTYQFGFLGVGNMGGALARAAAKTLPAEKIAVSSRTLEKAQAMAKELGCTALEDGALALRSDFVFLGVKPQVLPGVLRDLAPILASRREPFCLVSMADRHDFGHGLPRDPHYAQYPRRGGLRHDPLYCKQPGD